MNRNDFLNDIAFERYALAEFCRLNHNELDYEVIDLRATAVQYLSVGVAHASDGSRMRDALAALAFGAAWKVVDLMIEHAMKGLGQGTGGRILISTKQSFAQSGRSHLVAAIPRADLVDRVAETYACTVNLRHALTHRAVTFQNAVLSDGTTQMSVAHIEAFARVAINCAEVIAAGGIDQRSYSDTAHWLNQLGSIHRMPPIANAQQKRAIPLVLIAATPTDGAWTVNTREAFAVAQNKLRTNHYFDVQIHFPNTEHAPLSAHLDAAPTSEAAPVAPGVPLGWVRN